MKGVDYKCVIMSPVICGPSLTDMKVLCHAMRAQGSAGARPSDQQDSTCLGDKVTPEYNLRNSHAANWSRLVLNPCERICWQKCS